MLWTSDWAAVRIRIRPGKVGGVVRHREGGPRDQVSPCWPLPLSAVIHWFQRLSSQWGPSPEDTGGLHPSSEGREKKGCGPQKGS